MDISVPIVGFIFVCIIFPSIVKHKAQFYAAFGVLLLILVLDVLINIIGPNTTGMARFFLALRGILWIGDFMLLVLATGGLSLHELGSELKGAYEVIRRGEDTPTVVIPKSVYGDQIKAPGAGGGAGGGATGTAAPAAVKPVGVPPPVRTEDGPGTIPLE